ncbi:hypothetical protein [Actinoplanes sp. NPDC051859]|uniref:hypothetical protein n=1 Tax=Actinoplanes sp. NPDC051859 TaxID=3363909 RepID=UPI0037A6E22D
MDYLVSIPLILLLLGLIGLLFAASSAAQRDRQRTAARLGAIENKLDALIAHTGAVVTEPAYPEVEEFIRQHKMIHAVRAYRQETGADLLTAKNAVDAIAARLSR